MQRRDCHDLVVIYQIKKFSCDFCGIEISGGDSDDPCSSNPCQNEGECVDMGDGELYCFCEDGFSGDFCELGTCNH